MSDSVHSQRLIIDDQGEGRKKFRPSDWVDRISATLAAFGTDKRLRYMEEVHPCIIQGKKCLVVSRQLKETHPEIYEFIMHFATSNHLRIQEDRRVAPRPVPCERRSQAWHYEEKTEITQRQASSL